MVCNERGIELARRGASGQLDSRTLQRMEGRWRRLRGVVPPTSRLTWDGWRGGSSARRQLAQHYRALTGKPLGIIGEVAEFEAARPLNLELTPARTAGYDAIRIENMPARYNRGQRIGRIDRNKEFDAVLLVLMDESFNAIAIYEADRDSVLAALSAQSRNERGALPVSKFKSIARCVWSKNEAYDRSSS